MAIRAGATIPIRHGRLRRSSPILGILQIAGVAIVVLALSAGSIAGYAIWTTISNIAPGVHLAHLKNEPVPQVGSVAGAVNLLLTGSDTRTGQAGFQDRSDLAGSSGTGNNDVTMVLHISADHTHAVVVSIPRDLLTPIPACERANGSVVGATSRAMFNTTLSRGGLSCTVLTAEQLTGLTIQYAAEISFDGVIQMSDAVGGVTVCLATAIHDPYVGLTLSAGEHAISGIAALAFLRSRHGVGDGSDLGRISDQQLFLSALMRQITSKGVLSNPLTMYSLANAALKNMQLSDTLTAPATMVAIALALKNISLNNMVFVQWPSASNPAFPGRVVTSQAAASALDFALDHDRAIKLAGTTGRATESAPSNLATPLPTTGTATPAPTPTASDAPIVLPANITGQTAAQQTCAVGYLQKR
ncbi:MAG TPA: LCP family protein [Galbitalea sp.]|jgi:LCP family protein required for cell wall assembly|nr:LCP family protein [Galbitalea sp.]